MLTASGEVCSWGVGSELGVVGRRFRGGLAEVWVAEVIERLEECNDGDDGGSGAVIVRGGLDAFGESGIGDEGARQGPSRDQVATKAEQDAAGAAVGGSKWW
jgi:hypothetical protein